MDNTRPIPTPSGEQDRILDRALWYFWTEITLKRDIPTLTPTPHPQTATVGEIPSPGEDPPIRINIPGRFPQWITPNYWGRNYSTTGEICGLFYKTWVNAVSTKAADSEMMLVNKISYEIPDLPDNEVFEVEVLNNSRQLARWEDMKINGSAANPAEQFVFGGHAIPIPIWLRIDWGGDLTVRVRLLGPEDAAGNFPRTSTDQFRGNVKVLLQGFTSTMLETRDNVPRPADPAYPLNSYAEPMLDPKIINTAKKFMQYLNL